MRRLSPADRLSAAVLAICIAACYLSWGGHSDGLTHTSVNGFRVSILGDVCFAGLITAGLGLLQRFSLLHLGREFSRIAAIGLHVAAAMAVLQLVVGLAKGDGAGIGLALVIVGTAALEYLSIQVTGDPRRRALQLD
jgi:hypothetical protein